MAESQCIVLMPSGKYSIIKNEIFTVVYATLLLIIYTLIMHCWKALPYVN